MTDHNFLYVITIIPLWIAVVALCVAIALSGIIFGVIDVIEFDGLTDLTIDCDTAELYYVGVVEACATERTTWFCQSFQLLHFSSI